MVSLEEVNQEDNRSVYIHIPFCRKICTYCDFCKMFYNEDLVDKYLIALEKEVSLLYKGSLLKTIYVGGGTPSCLNKRSLNKLFSIIDRFNLDNDVEFTFECNINDITEDLLVFLKSNKVNRLSIGIESFNNKILNILGRDYSDINIKDRIDLVKKYFNNINIDLIYGVRSQSLDDLKDDLEKFIGLDINHISIYSLILEDNTMLKISDYKEIDEDLNREMYDYIVSFLEDNGYIHYEISNFSKKGYFSRHNLNYWNNDRYYGFGLGASGYINNIRYTNTRSLSKYTSGNFLYEKDIVSKNIDMENFMILGLRKMKGVSNKVFNDRYNTNIEDVFDVSKLEKKGDYYYIGRENIYISNYILEDFIDIESDYE